MADIIPINANNKVDVYVPFGGCTVDLGEGAVAPAPEYPLLQYATGLAAQRPKIDSEGRQVIDEDTGEVLMDNLYYAGLFTAKGKDKELDEAMQAKGAQWIDIIHGKGEVVRHWAIEKTALFLIAKGVPGNANSNGQTGMVYQWRQKRNSPKSETILYAQVIVRSLLPNYTKPFQFTIKSTQTVDVLNAMRKQYKVLDAAHEMMRARGRDIDLPLWAYSIMFGPSTKKDQRGQGENSKTIFPLICGVPNEINGQYLQRHEVPLEYVEHLQKCTEKAVEWAQALSQRITAGVESHEPWKQDDAATDSPF